MEDDGDDDGHPPKTIMFRSFNLERALGLSKIFLKFEGTNPTGTQKDRVSVLHANRASQDGYDTLTVGTCGNYGTSIAYYSNLKNLNSVIFIPSKYHTKRLREMVSKYKSRIMLVEGEYEDAVEASKTYAKEQGWYNANPGNGGTALNMEGYASIAREIVQDLGKAPTAVATPVGNGTTLSGIFHGFEKLYNDGIIDHIPKMVAASTYGGNPVVKSFKMGLNRVIDLKPNEIKESTINEPLISYHAYDGERALQALIKSEGFAEYASDSKMLYYSRLMKELDGLNVLPASTAALEAMRKVLLKNRLNSEYVIVLTGRRV